MTKIEETMQAFGLGVCVLSVIALLLMIGYYLVAALGLASALLPVLALICWMVGKLLMAMAP